MREKTVSFFQKIVLSITQVYLLYTIAQSLIDFEKDNINSAHISHKIAFIKDDHKRRLTEITCLANGILI